MPTVGIPTRFPASWRRGAMAGLIMTSGMTVIRKALVPAPCVVHFINGELASDLISRPTFAGPTWLPS
jgi:hypothetical protein